MVFVKFFANDIILGRTLLHSFTYTLCRFFGYAIFTKYCSLPKKKNVAFCSFRYFLNYYFTSFICHTCTIVHRFIFLLIDSMTSVWYSQWFKIYVRRITIKLSQNSSSCRLGNTFIVDI